MQRVSRREALVVIGSGLLYAGCGTGRKVEPDTTDYYADILPARWNKSGIKFRVEGGSPIPPTQSRVRRAVRDAFYGWRDSLSGLLVIEETKGTEPADVPVVWVPVGALGGDFFGNQTLGITDLKVDNSVKPGIILSSRIRLDSQLWYRLPTLPIIAGHEFGHGGIGIQGHSRDSRDLMNANPARSNPSARDTNTARKMYQATQARTRAESNIVVYRSTLAEDKDGKLIAVTVELTPEEAGL